MLNFVYLHKTAIVSCDQYYSFVLNYPLESYFASSSIGCFVGNCLRLPVVQIRVPAVNLI